MDNTLEKYTTINFKETDSTATMAVTIPEYNPRGKIPALVFNVNDAINLAEQKYGDRVLHVHGGTLENRPGINVLKGEYTVKLEPKKVKQRRPRTAKTNNSQTNK